MKEREQEMLEAMAALHAHCNALTARLYALEVFTDAILGTLGKSLPPLLPVIQDNLFSLADAREQELQESIQEQFRSHIAHADRKVEALK